VVCGDGEYIIYTSQALRNKAFGSALDFVWSSQGTGDYAVKESFSRVRTFKSFKDHKQINLPITSADALFGGVCLAVKGGDSVVFFDWEVHFRRVWPPCSLPHSLTAFPTVLARLARPGGRIHP